MLLFGLFCGFLAALGQSVNYLFSGRFVREAGRPASTMLIPAFVAMGVYALPGLLLMLPHLSGAACAAQGTAYWVRFLGESAACIVCCIFGNLGLMWLLKSVDPSRSSPLLILKIPMLAMFYGFVLGEPMPWGKWVAVALMMGSIFMMIGAGRPVPLRAVPALLFACFFYSASDWCIQLSIVDARALVAVPFHATLFSFFLIYALGAVLCLPLLPFAPRLARRDVKRHLLPFSLSWYLAILILFFSFDNCGIVLGNIVQSMRGLLSIVLGWFVARAGATQLEERVRPVVFLRRLAAGALIIAAMALYATATKG